MSRLERIYPMLARLNYLKNYSKESKKSFLAFYESYTEETEDEVLEVDIKKCFNLDAARNPTTAKTSQGKICESLLNKKQQEFFFSLDTPLSRLGCLLPNNTDINLSVRLMEDEMLFNTKTDCKPKLHIDSIKVISQFVILDKSLISRIEHRLASKNLQVQMIKYNLSYLTVLHLIFVLNFLSLSYFFSFLSLTT